MLVRMTSAKNTRYDTDLLETLSKRVMVGDGAMGTQLQAADLSLDDFYNRRRRGRDEIRSAAIWFSLVTTTLPTGSASWRSRAPRSPSGSGRAGRPDVGGRRRLFWSRGVATVPGPCRYPPRSAESRK